MDGWMDGGVSREPLPACCLQDVGFDAITSLLLVTVGGVCMHCYRWISLLCCLVVVVSFRVRLVEQRLLYCIQ
jgi:hypothetical protein